MQVFTVVLQRGLYSIFHLPNDWTLNALFVKYIAWVNCFIVYIDISWWKPWALKLSNELFGEGNGNPVQYSCLENPVDGGAWYGVAMSRTWRRDFTFTFHFHALEKEMTTHSCILTWRIPGIREPSGLPSMRSYRVGHHWSDSSSSNEFFKPQSSFQVPFGYLYVFFEEISIRSSTLFFFFWLVILFVLYWAA